jgi:hypothetical protein
MAMAMRPQRLCWKEGRDTSEEGYGRPPCPDRIYGVWQLLNDVLSAMEILGIWREYFLHVGEDGRPEDSVGRRGLSRKLLDRYFRGSDSRQED